MHIISTSADDTIIQAVSPVSSVGSAGVSATSAATVVSGPGVVASWDQAMPEKVVRVSSSSRTRIRL